MSHSLIIELSVLKEDFVSFIGKNGEHLPAVIEVEITSW